ncbi:MAG: hypothetical protein ABDI20_02240, partial [Candidatus Bipolaricaulaceae bacterium]
AIYLMIYALGEYAKKYMFLKDRVDFAAEFLPSVLLAAAQIDEVDVRTNLAKGLGLKPIASGLTEDGRPAVLYEQDLKPTPTQEYKDYVLAFYTDIQHEIQLKKKLDAALKILETVTAWVDNPGIDKLSNRFQKNVDKTGGVDVVAVVPLEELNPAAVQAFLDVIKKHKLYEEWEKRVSHLKPWPTYRYELVSTAFVAAWKEKNGEKWKYIWLDYGPAMTPWSVRDDIMQALLGKEVEEVPPSEAFGNPHKNKNSSAAGANPHKTSNPHKISPLVFGSTSIWMESADASGGLYMTWERPPS